MSSDGPWEDPWPQLGHVSKKEEVAVGQGFGGAKGLFPGDRQRPRAFT